MTRLLAVTGGVGRLRKALAGSPESWVLFPFLLPLPAAVFAWWALIVRPIWMPELEVREAVVTGYLLCALLPMLALFADPRPRGPAGPANLFTLATLFFCGASTFTYPGTASLYLAILGTATGVGAIALAARSLLLALRDVRDRAVVNYFLVVLPAVLIVIVGQTVLWGSDRSGPIRLSAVALCALAVWGRLGLRACLPVPFARLLAVLGAGLTLAVAAEALRWSGVKEYALTAQVLQGFGGRFVAYFSAGMGLSLLPSAVRRESSASKEEGEHSES